MAIPQTVPLSPRAQQYFDQVYKPRFEAFQNAVKQVSLAILVWGPGESAGDLYRKRLQIRDELRRLGHCAVFSEELTGMNPMNYSQKGIEFLQARSSDFIVVMQCSYGSVAEVHDFANFSVISHKMLIFIDQAAEDGYSYQGALAELKILYNNVETYKYPEDIVQCHLLKKILVKVNALQMVRYREQTNPPSWAASPTIRGATFPLPRPNTLPERSQ